MQAPRTIEDTRFGLYLLQVPVHGRGYSLKGLLVMLNIRLAAAAAFAACVFAQPAAAGEQDFVLVNATGYDIYEVYVSETQAPTWEEDVLGREILPDGGRFTIRFSPSEGACLWDMRAVYEDGEIADWQGFNLCELSVIAVSYDEETGETTAEYE